MGLRFVGRAWEGVIMRVYYLCGGVFLMLCGVNKYLRESILCYAGLSMFSIYFFW